MKIAIVIPARYASTRFPGKPLVDIAGKTMIQRVYEQCLKVKSVSQVIVATDDERIANEVKQFAGEVCMTSNEHNSGTDRIQEVVTKLNLQEDIIINVQGDEPFINPEQIEALLTCFEDEKTEIATLIKPIESLDTLQNLNTPKVIVNKNNFAIYFSREAIPHLRNVAKEYWLSQHTYFQHIGIYAFRKNTLAIITSLPPSLLEKAESLEQLRWIDNGFQIKTAITTIETTAIDTPSDLEKVLIKYNSKIN